MAARTPDKNSDAQEENSGILVVVQNIVRAINALQQTVSQVFPFASTIQVFNGDQPSTSSVLNYFAWANVSAAPTGDVTTSVQNFLLDCQLVALRLKSASGSDANVQRSFVTAYLPRGRYQITSPLIVPEYVNLKCDGIMIRTGALGTITSFYTGDTTSLALANLYQPMLIITPRGHAETVNIICNSNGSDRGSGMTVGKNWTMTAVAINTAGTGYLVNDVLTFYQPSVSPYIAATFTVTAINGAGGITAGTLTQAGAYGLPPVLQQQQWTSGNNFNGAFDAFGNLSVSGGTGTGASLAPTWQADWTVAGGKNYQSGLGGIISDYIIDHVYITQSARTFDNVTYGPLFCIQFYGLNGRIGEIETQSGFHGIRFNSCSDLHIEKLNPVDAEIGVYMNRGSSVYCNEVIIDTPTGNAPCLEMDQCTNVVLKGCIFNHNLNNLGAPYGGTIWLGANSSGTQMNTNIQLDFIITNAGAGGDSSHLTSIGGPVVLIEQTQFFDINVTVANNAFGYGGVYAPNSTIVNFGASGNVRCGRIRGSIDASFRTLYSGTLPLNCDLDIMDGDVSIVNGTVTATVTATSVIAGDVLSFSIDNPYLTKAFALPTTPSYTAAGGESVTALATALVTAIKNDTRCQLIGITASSSLGVITIYQMGVVGNNTTVTASVTGTGDEAIAMSNAGVISGAISGGKLGTGGLYRLVGNGAPVNGTVGTGWKKAITGSEYTDNATGNFYKNTGTATSPTWTLVS